MKRINWKNIFKATVMLACGVMVLKDIYKITIHSWFTNQYTGFTMLGFITFVVFLTVAVTMYVDLTEQLGGKYEKKDSLR